jgi:hypothetical protein
MAGADSSRPWSIQDTSDVQVNAGEVSGVSCPETDWCVALGSSTSSTGSGTLAESWNGTAWSIQPTPIPPGSTNSKLAGVSCSAPDACMAVGVAISHTGSYAALTEAWNGTS